MAITDRGPMRGFDRFLELVPDAILVVQPDCRIVAANDYALRLFGYSHDELVGKKIDALVPQSRRARLDRLREAHFAEPSARRSGQSLELTGLRKDGSEFRARLNLSTVETAEGLLAAAVVRDLESESERRAVEGEMLEARDQQTHRLESIGELAGGIAHDFNNLLAVIRSNSELALEGAGESGEVSEAEAEFLREELEEIKYAADHAAKLTTQLLVFSRRESSTREPVDLNVVVEKLEQLLQRSIGDHIVLEVALAPDLPLVMADPNKMEQIVLNLAINARDAMSTGGELCIETAVAEVDEEYSESNPNVDPGRYVRLTVADTGAGMPREIAARAFEPFFSTKPKGEGTGLGLATVYGIVKSSGGHVSIDSEEGSGTTIRVDLPLAEAAAKPPVQAQPPDEFERGKGQTILVVEDEDRLRRTIVRLLKRGGYEVAAARSGDAALEILKQGDAAVDLVLTDVQMPGMSGAALGEEVRALRPGLPILYMSGYADPSTSIGPEEKVILKPFAMVELFGRIAHALKPAAPED